MKVLVRGTEHRHAVATLRCEFCASVVRILEGDPRSHFEYRNGGRRITWICPVCHAYGDKIVDECTTYSEDRKYDYYEKDSLISLEDKKEIEGFKDDHLDDLSEEDVDHVYAWEQYRKFHPDPLDDEF